MNIEVTSSSENEAGSSQKEMLFMRGKAMSGAPIIKGTIQLPNPPIIAGMTVKNTMIKPCAATTTSNTFRVAENLKAGLHQLGAHGHRQQPRRYPPTRRRRGTSCRCLCDWSE